MWRSVLCPHVWLARRARGLLPPRNSAQLITSLRPLGGIFSGGVLWSVWLKLTPKLPVTHSDNWLDNASFIGGLPFPASILHSPDGVFSSTSLELTCTQIPVLKSASGATQNKHWIFYWLEIALSEVPQIQITLCQDWNKIVGFGNLFPSLCSIIHSMTFTFPGSAKFLGLQRWIGWVI